MTTSGVVPGIRRLTALGPQFTLAISLHAARNALRDVLVPLNRRWPVEEVVAAAREHAQVTGRRVTYEDTMIDGVNDTDVDADAMADLLRGELAHVNLIPMNPVAHTPWTGTPIPTGGAVRGAPPGGGHRHDDPVNRGKEIGAACGQLAAEQAGQPTPIVVQRRRERLVAPERGRAPRRAQHRARPGRGGGAMSLGRHRRRRPAGVLIAASILDADLAAWATRSAGRDGRARTGSTST